MGTTRFPHSITTVITSYLYAFFVLFFCSHQVHANSVWKITSNKSGTVYLVGDPRALLDTDYPLSSLYEAVYDASSVVVTEYDFIRLSQQEAFKAKFSTEIDRSSIPLSKRIDEPDWDRLVSTLDDLHIERVETIRLKPSIIATLMLQQKLHKSGYNSPGLAQYFYTKATAGRKIVESLELSDDYLKFFFSMDKASDAVLIKSTLDDINHFDAIMESKRAAWYTGDPQLIQQAYINPLRERMPHVAQILLDQRIKHWMPAIIRQLDSYQTVMIIVGLEYIPGEHGIMNTLKNMGYQCERIDSI